MLGRGRVCGALVISHSCDLDKNEAKSLVLVAPIASAARLGEPEHRNIFAGRRRAFFPLVLVPQLGDAYADLRLIAPVDREVLDPSKKLASMSKEALDLLHTHLAGFLLRAPNP